MTTTTQIPAHAPFVFGETGAARVERGGIYARREENDGWRFLSELTDVIHAEARRDAATFAGQFPGQEPEGDWDATAWQMREISGGLLAELEAIEEVAGRDLGWEVYQVAFLAEVRRLNRTAA